MRRLSVCAALAAAISAHAEVADLTQMGLEQLMELTVVGASKYEQKQSQVAAAASVITREEIQAFGWRTVAEAIASLPGVSQTYDRQYSYVGARGLSIPGDLNTRLLVTIDGNRVNDSLYDQGYLGREFPLDIGLVERIEFIPGPGSAVYGQNAMLGVVNVITRKGSDVNGGELAAAYQAPQSTREGRITWGKVLDNGVDVLVSFSGLRSTGDDHFFNFCPSPNGECGSSPVAGEARSLDGERIRQFAVRASRGAWAVELLQGDRVKYDPAAGFLTNPLTSGQYQEDRITLGQITYEDVFADNTLRVTGRLFGGQESFHDYLPYGDRPLQPSSSHDPSAVYTEPAIGQWRGIELRALSTAFDDHKVMFGTEYQENNRIRMNVNDSSGATNDVHIALTGYRLGVFAQDEWQITQTLASTVGVRVDRNDLTGTHWSPRAALIWTPAQSTTLKALYGRANRAPNAFESKFGNGIDQTSNPALKDETIDTVELVADHRVNRELSLRASVYQWTLRDLIMQGVDPVTGLSQYQTSTSPVKAHGLELSASQQWERGARLRGSVSMQDVHYEGGSALSNSPHMLARLNFLTPLPWAGLRMGYEFRYDGWRRTEAGDTTGGFAVSNLRLSTSSWVRGVELSLDIKNLFDRTYSHPAANTNWQDALQQDGRSVGIAMRCNF